MRKQPLELSQLRIADMVLEQPLLKLLHSHIALDFTREMLSKLLGQTLHLHYHVHGIIPYAVASVTALLRIVTNLALFNAHAPPAFMLDGMFGQAPSCQRVHVFR